MSTWYIILFSKACTGKYFADTTLWLTIACVLATMMISMEEGTVVDQDIEQFHSDLGMW